MRAAITTRYVNPTNTRGSRYKALARTKQTYALSDDTSPELSLTLNAQPEFGLEQNHCAAARALAVKLGWDGLYIGGGNPDGTGYTFVCLELDASDFHTGQLFGRENYDWFYVSPSEPKGS